MKRHWIGAIATVAVIGVVVVLAALASGEGPSVAAASTSTTAQVTSVCDLKINDPTGTIGQRPDVQNALNLFAGQHIDARVLVASEGSDATPEQLFRAMRDQCSSWQGAGDGPAANMAVFAFNQVTRTGDVFVGNTWQQVFSDPNVHQRIWTNQFPVPTQPKGIDVATYDSSRIGETLTQIEGDHPSSTTAP